MSIAIAGSPNFSRVAHRTSNPVADKISTEEGDHLGNHRFLSKGCIS